MSVPCMPRRKVIPSWRRCVFLCYAQLCRCSEEVHHRSAFSLPIKYQKLSKTWVLFHLIAVCVCVFSFTYSLIYLLICLVSFILFTHAFIDLFTPWIVLVCLPKCERAPPPSENNLQGQGQVTSFCLGAGQGRST